MLKTFISATTISTATFLVCVAKAVSLPVSVETVYPVEPDPEVYPPVCLIETNEGTTLDLVQLCGYRSAASSTTETATPGVNPGTTTTITPGGTLPPPPEALPGTTTINVPQVPGSALSPNAAPGQIQTQPITIQGDGTQ